MRVALVHDDLVQWGGAERVLLALSEIFPEAPIYTSIFDRTNSLLCINFGSKKINTSFLQQIPFKRNLYKILLPFYPIAFEQFDFSNYDLVISHTTRFAKAIVTKPKTLHVCYCHTPPRFLWSLSENSSFKLAFPYLNYLRVYDEISSRRVDKWIAGSENARERIKKIYKKDSLICTPFVDEIFFSSKISFDGDYFLLVSRLNSYKKIDLAVDLFNENNIRLIIIGEGPELNNLKKKAKENIEFFEQVTDQTLVFLLAGAKALIVTAEEDFGLVALEAQAMGKSVVAFKRGGASETVIDEKTGFLFEEQNKESLKKALNKVLKFKINPQDCVENAKRFSEFNFRENFLKTLKCEDE